MPDEFDSHTFTNRAPKPNFLTHTRFEEFNLPDEMNAGLLKAGFEYCTPIQAQVLPISLKGMDVAGQAQTGTGKTAAFLVTIFTRLLTQPEKSSGRPSAIIVAPTRELASQIYEDALILGSHTNFNIAQIVGGIDYRKQADILTRGTDIIVCTPGRIIDYFKQGIFKTTDIKILIIDEADRLLDLGFAQDMRFILKKLPHYEKRQSMLFSATLSHRVMELTYEYMNLPEFISVTPEEITVDGIHQTLFHVGNDEKFSLLLGLLEREPWERVLIFANTKIGVQWITQKLKGNRLPAEGITGDLPQAKRFRLMKRFKEGSIKILVATDVASRGIHVEDITHVFNYDLPQDPENYIHRIGRTARAGKTGHSITFACEKYVYHLAPLEQFLGFTIPVVWAKDDWFKEDQSGPVSVGRKKLARRPVRKSSRTVQKKKPVDAKDRKRNERKSSGPDRPRRFPGAFFGFGPKPEEEKTSTLSAKRNTSGKK